MFDSFLGKQLHHSPLISEKVPENRKTLREKKIAIRRHFDWKMIANANSITIWPNICPFGSIIGILCSFNGAPVTLYELKNI